MSSARRTTNLDDAVVQGLYEAAAGARPWGAAMGALDDVIGVLGSQMLVVDKATGRLLISETPDHTPPDAVLDYVREYHRIDPHTQYLVTRPVGEIMHTADLFPAQTYASHPFYRDFWTPYNVRSFVGTKLAEDERHVAAIGIMRSLDQPSYTSAETALVGRYLGHLVVAVRIARFLQKVHAAAVVGHGLMEGSTRPMILVDRQLGIRAANSAARRYFASGSTFYAEDEVLKCRNARGERTVSSAVAQMLVDSAVTEKSTQVQRRAVRVAGKGNAFAFCSLWGMRPEFTMGAFGQSPAILLTVCEPDQKSALDPMLVASIFDLTPAEARIGVELMDGPGIAAIAARLRVSNATVKSHLKSIFLKTGTHRQAELVRLLLQSTSL